MDAKKQFHELAAKALEAGLLTRQEVALIARAGTRKQRYWARHLADLRVVIRERRDDGR